MPSPKEYCAKCLRYRLKSDLAKETREDSPIKGKLVCAESPEGNGCLDGPTPGGGDGLTPKNRRPDNYYKKQNV